MSVKSDYYQCQTCGNMVKVVNASGVVMVCCGKEMSHLEAKTEANPKHHPVVTPEANGIEVSIGEVEHPMEDEHFIQFIEVIGDGCSMTQELIPGVKPSVFFPIPANNVKEVRAYCNIHGLWKNNKIEEDEGGLYNV